jgi:hypothetical protein
MYLLSPECFRGDVKLARPRASEGPLSARSAALGGRKKKHKR